MRLKKQPIVEFDETSISPERSPLAEAIISPAGVKAFGSIHSCFVLTVLCRLYFEHLEAGELTPEGRFEVTNKQLQNETQLGYAAVHRNLKLLEERGAIEIISLGGKKPLCKIKDKIIRILSRRMNPDKTTQNRSEVQYDG